MDEMTQPQVVQAANQPEPSYGGDMTDMQQGNAASAGTPEGGARAAASTDEGTGPFLTVRYNKQDKPLSREEAAVYAQKGMNYDKLVGRLKAAEEQVKALSGGKTAEYTVKEGVSESPSHSSGLTAPDPGSPQNAILRGGKQGGLRTPESNESAGVPTDNKPQGSVRSVQTVVNAQLGEFAAAHPDVDPGRLPAPVLAEWKKGVPLSEAYGAYQAREADRQERAQTANAVNAAASMGGAGSIGAAHPQPITDEAIQSMSPAELDKNHTRIWAYLTGQKS